VKIDIFKQKTAYEIPKRDWSSDVCSSDLGINTLANYNFTSYNLNPLKFVEVDSVGRVSTDIDFMTVDKVEAMADNTLNEVLTINKAANQ